MFKIISHRGNLDGPIKKLENNPKYVKNALKKGYDVEIDVWYFKNNYFLGHDEPVYKINLNFLKNKNFWCHAKNFEAMENMLKNKIHCFWHENDKLTLTSKKFFWCYPKNYIQNGITVVLNKNKNICKNKFTGICTDYPNYYSNLFKNF
jgi:hypothetical protein